MNSVDKSINSVLEKIIMDIMEYDGTSLSVYCNHDNINKSVALTSSFDTLLGLKDFYLKTYNDEFLTLKTENVDGLFNWLLDGTCGSFEIHFSTYKNQQEEHCCDTNNLSGISLCFDSNANVAPTESSYKFEPLKEVYKDRGYEVSAVVELLTVLCAVKPYMTEEYFNKRKLLCNIAGNWKPLIR